MAEIGTEVRTHIVSYQCDTCKKGYMESTGPTLMSNPPRYPHRCNNQECRKEETFTNTYPTLRTLPV